MPRSLLPSRRMATSARHICNYARTRQGNPAWMAALLAFTLTSPALMAHADTDLRYEVMPGDTLERLAQRLMEQPRRYREIVRLNGLGNQDLISPG